MVRTQHMGPYKHGWSQKLYKYVNDLRIMAFNILIKTWIIKNKNHKRTYGYYVYACVIDLGHTY